ncbi:helix-turn-helix domain-containing protein [Filimonas lacunae]|nr:AraC family transcriptional regulator [Filimonas lacunae]
MKVTFYRFGLPEEGKKTDPSRHLSTKHKLPWTASMESHKFNSGTVLSQQFAAKKFTVYHYVFLVQQPASIRISVEQPSALLHCVLEGNSEALLQNGNKLTLKEKSYQQAFYPKGDSEFNLPPGTHQWLFIAATPAFLEDFAENNTHPREVMERLQNASNQSHQLNSASIGYEAQHVIDQLLDLNPHPHYATLDIRTLLEKLFRQYLADAKLHPVQPPDEYAKLQELRWQLRTQPNAHVHTIKYISSKYSIPGKNLTKLYYSLYGVSLEKEIRDQLMKYAVFLIKTSEQTFEDISDELGYADRHCFTRAVTRKTGKTPSCIRKEYRENRNFG